MQTWLDTVAAPLGRALEAIECRDSPMESLLKGRLRNTHLPYSNALIPLFEGIVNSIHSIEDDAKSGGRQVRQHQITVRLERSPQKSLGIEPKTAPREPIVAIVVEDDGVGFNAANWASFGVLDSLEKASRGCRGIGRLTWLKAFDRVSVDSIYADGGSLYRRRFVFDPDRSVHPVANEEVDPQAKRTIVRLEGFDRRYAEVAPKTARTIAVAVLEHCLWYFVRKQGAPKIVVEDDEDCIDLDDLFDEHMHASAKAEPIVIKGQDFELTNVKFRAAVSKTHVAHYCAAGRVVRSDSLRDRVPGLNGILQDAAGPFTYAGYLTSKYFDERVSGQRVDFNIDETATGLFAEQEISFEDIRASLVPHIKDYLGDALVANIAAGRERVDSFVAKKAPRYRPILSYVAEADLAVDPGITDASLDALLHKQLFRVEQALISEGHTILGPQDAETEAEYIKRLDEYLQKVSDLKRSDLADYVMHRRTVIELLDRAIQRGSDGKFAREDMIHEIIVPMRITSDDTKFRRNSLWLIDERLAFHDFLASDRPIKSMPITTSESPTEPDIAVLRTFDNPLAVSENETGPQASITVVEIKRPMRADYRERSAEADDPIQQALGYLRRLRQGASTKTGRPIPNAEKIPGFVYVIADLTKSLQERCEFHQLTATSDGMGYFGYHTGKGYEAYVQVMSFDGLVASAKERHRAFFDKLGLPTH